MTTEEVEVNQHNPINAAILGDFHLTIDVCVLTLTFKG